MSVDTPPEIVIVKSPSGAKSHRLDTRYAVLGQALCGAAIVRERLTKPLDPSQDCKRCRDLAGELAP